MIATTSRDAYQAILPTRGTRQAEVLDMVYFNYGSTRGEIAEKLKRGVNKITGRVKEMIDVGLICEGVPRPCTSKESGGAMARPLYVRTREQWMEWHKKQERLSREQVMMDFNGVASGL